MKVRYLNVLVTTIVAVGTAGAAEIYNKDGSVLNLFGSLNSGYYLSNDHNKNGNHSCATYGLSGRSQINDQLIGFGAIEGQMGLQYVENANIVNHKIKLGYVGIKYGNFGSIDYGRNYGLLHDVGSWTNVMPEFGGDNLIVDNFFSSRASNVFTYRNDNFFGLVDGLNFALQYQGNNEDNTSDTNSISVNEVNGDGYAISLSYTLDNGIAASAAYSNSKRTASQKMLSADDVADNNASAYSFGLKYNNHDLYLAALYGETHNMTPFGNFKEPLDANHMYGFIEKAKNFELVAQYQFDCGLRPSIGYLQSRASSVANNYNTYLKKYIELGSSYNFNRNMLAKIDYRFNLIKQDSFTKVAGISTDNVFALGMSYIF